MAGSRAPIGQWLFVVSAALFIGGIAFIVAGARTAQPAAAPRAEVPAPVPVASIKQMMNSIVMPNDQEWTAVGDSAAAIIESGNMLLVGDRLIDTREWLSYTQRFIAAGKAVLTAAEQKKPDGVLAAGGDLNETCDACHDKYQRR